MCGWRWEVRRFDCALIAGLMAAVKRVESTRDGRLVTGLQNPTSREREREPIPPFPYLTFSFGYHPKLYCSVLLLVLLRLQ